MRVPKAGEVEATSDVKGIGMGGAKFTGGGAGDVSAAVATVVPLSAAAGDVVVDKERGAGGGAPLEAIDTNKTQRIENEGVTVSAEEAVNSGREEDLSNNNNNNNNGGDGDDEGSARAPADAEIGAVDMITEEEQSPTEDGPSAPSGGDGGGGESAGNGDGDTPMTAAVVIKNNTTTAATTGKAPRRLTRSQLSALPHGALPQQQQPLPVSLPQLIGHKHRRQPSSARGSTPGVPEHTTKFNQRTKANNATSFNTTTTNNNNGGSDSGSNSPTQGSPPDSHMMPPPAKHQHC